MLLEGTSSGCIAGNHQIGKCDVRFQGWVSCIQGSPRAESIVVPRECSRLALVEPDNSAKTGDPA